jgi:hypothetical protein
MPGMPGLIAEPPLTADSIEPEEEKAGIGGGGGGGGFGFLKIEARQPTTALAPIITAWIIT